MYVLVVLVLTTLGVYSTTVPEDIQQYWITGSSTFQSTCECATGVNPVLSDRLFKYLEYPNDPCLKCYIKCVFKEGGLINTDGTLNRNNWLMMPGVNETIFDFCSAQNPGVVDMCKIAFDFSLCVVEQNRI